MTFGMRFFSFGVANFQGLYGNGAMLNFQPVMNRGSNFTAWNVQNVSCFVYEIASCSDHGIAEHLAQILMLRFLVTQFVKVFICFKTCNPGYDFMYCSLLDSMNYKVKRTSLQIQGILNDLEGIRLESPATNSWFIDSSWCWAVRGYPPGN